MRIAVGAIAALVALTTSSSIAAHPAAPASAARSAATGNPTLDAANALIAEPWRGLAAQAAADAERGIKESFEDRAIVNWSGKATYKGQKIARWTLKLETKKITSNVNITAPPGIREASPTSLKLGAPLDGTWSFRIAGLVAPNVKVKVGSTTLFSWSPGGVQFGLRIENFRTRLSTGIQAPGPLDGTNVPRLVSPSLAAQMTFGGQGFIPTLVPVQFTVRPAGSNLELAAPIANIPLNLGPVDARFTGHLVLSVLPTQTELNTTYPRISKGRLAGEGEIGVTLQHIRVALRGTVSFSIPRFGSHAESLDLGFPLVIPATDAITNARALLAGKLPLVWGENASPDPPSGAPSGAVFAGEAEEIESAIVPHLLEGQVLSLDSPQNGSPVPGFGTPELAYGVEADSAIWTGHYLAAEAFRHAATSSPAALERLKLVLGGIQRQFEVTTDAVVADGRATPVRVPGPHGFFSRVAWPSTSSINFPVDPNKSSAMTGPLRQRGCFYIDPEGGWQRFDGQPKGTIYPDLQSAFAALSTTSPLTGLPVPPGVDIPGGQAPRDGELVPLGKVWYGWGCGTNHPLSRDQYSGIMLGLSIANRLVPDATVQATTKKLITQVVDYLLFHRWNVVLPPSNRIVATSSMLGNFDKQLAWLRVAASIDPGHVAPGGTLTYQQRYDAAKAAAGILWVPALMAVVDPKLQYYKFNLTHAALVPLLVYEQDPALRAIYMTSPNVLWGKLRFHRNAHFGLLRVLMSGQNQWATTANAPSALAPGLTLGGEIKAVLGEWLRRRELVPGLNGLPRNTLGHTTVIGGQPPGATYEQNLAPARIAFYKASDGSRSCLATYALPVWARSGFGMDFAWQKQPFEVAYDQEMCTAGMQGTKPSVGELLDWAHLNPRREGPGVDYLLPYWLGRYVKVIPPS